MIYNMYSLYDEKTKVFSSPVISVNDEVMIRSFKNDVNDFRSSHFKLKDDLILYRVGTFDSSTGTMSSISPTELVLRGSDVERSATYEKDEVVNLVNVIAENNSNVLNDIFAMLDKKITNENLINSQTLEKVDTILQCVEKKVGGKLWEKIKK